MASHHFSSFNGQSTKDIRDGTFMFYRVPVLPNRQCEYAQMTLSVGLGNVVISDQSF